VADHGPVDFWMKSISGRPRTQVGQGKIRRGILDSRVEILEYRMGVDIGIPGT